MQKNLLMALAGVVCVSVLSSCGTFSKKEEETPKVEQTQAPENRPMDENKDEEGKDLAQAPAAGQEATTQVAQAPAPVEATQTAAAPTDAPTNEQKA